ncbi:MAG: hypothetical protein ACRD0C_12905 [Acidimicrobiia bacterium]
MSRNVRAMLLVLVLVAAGCGHRGSVQQVGAPAEETAGDSTTTTLGSATPETTVTSAAASGDVEVVKRIPGTPGSAGSAGGATAPTR